MYELVYSRAEKRLELLVKNSSTGVKVPEKLSLISKNIS